MERKREYSSDFTAGERVREYSGGGHIEVMMKRGVCLIELQQAKLQQEPYGAGKLGFMLFLLQHKCRMREIDLRVIEFTRKRE